MLPARASLKLDFRLVPDQKPEEILEKLRAQLNNQDFGGVEIAHWHGIDPSRTPIDHPAVEIIKDAISEVFARRPLCIQTSAAADLTTPSQSFSVSLI